MASVPIAAAAVVAAPSWRLDSEPVELDCGDDALKLPPPAAAVGSAAPRALVPDPALTVCQRQASAAAACDCLAKSVTSWSAMSGPAACAPAHPAGSDAQVVEIDSDPPDGPRSGAEAFVVVARRGSAWSAIDVVEHSAEIHYDVTPKLTSQSKLTRVEVRPLADGALYWIESEAEQTERGIGEHAHDGAAHATICIVPSAGSAPASCTSLPRASWQYALDDSKSGPDACAITRVSVYAVALDGAARTATVTLTAGADSGSAAGRYRF